MTDQKKTTTLEYTTEQAEKLEAEARSKEDVSTYTHTFKKPFTFEGVTYEKLTFNWDSLSGRDSVAIERELLRRGLTTVMAEFTPEYLAAMAARACAYRNDEGFRTVTTDTIYAIPLQGAAFVKNNLPIPHQSGIGRQDIIRNQKVCCRNSSGVIALTRECLKSSTFLVTM